MDDPAKHFLFHVSLAILNFFFITPYSRFIVLKVKQRSYPILDLIEKKGKDSIEDQLLCEQK